MTKKTTGSRAVRRAFGEIARKRQGGHCQRDLIVRHADVLQPAPVQRGDFHQIHPEGAGGLRDDPGGPCQNNQAGRGKGKGGLALLPQRPAGGSQQGRQKNKFYKSGGDAHAGCKRQQNAHEGSAPVA